MSPERITSALFHIADRLDATRRLVSAAEMATDRCERYDRDALCELLQVIVKQLDQVAGDIRAVQLEAA